MLLNTTSKKIEIDNLIIIDWECLHQVNVEIEKVEDLLTVPNLEYKALVQFKSLRVMFRTTTPHWFWRKLYLKNKERHAS